jgi:tripartite-type tricarboxylate transporter receptor subunit TctC
MTAHPLPASSGAPARRTFVLSAVALAALAFAMPNAAKAQDYPAGKVVKLVVGYPPGGSNDIVARLIAPRLGEVLGTSVVVENRAGVSGAVGADYVTKSAPDGLTLLFASASPVVITPHTIPKIAFNTLTDFAPVNTVGLTPEAIAVSPSLGVKTLKDLLALSQKQQVSLSSSGTGGMPHLTIELLMQASKNSKFVHVPYKGAGPAITDTLAGHVNGIVMDVTPLYPLIKEGKLQALALTSDKRAEFLPDVPTAQDELPGFAVTNWLGLFAPAKTPPAIINKLNDALVKIVAREDVKAQLLKNAVVPSTMASPAAFTQFVASEYNRWGKLVKDKNIVAE